MIRETVEITDLSFDGRGIGRCADGRVVFASGTLPGDFAELRISGEGRSLTGRLVELKKPSEHRIEPDCPYFGRCGGCSLRNFAYEAQLAWKEDFVRNALVRIGGLQDPVVRPARGMNHPYRYRNKAVFAVEEGVPGFFASGSRELVPIDDCLLLEQEICDALDAKRAKLSKNCTKLTFRSSHFGEVMTVKEYSDGNITADRRVLEDIIETDMASLKLEVGPQSFYQVNPRQTSVLYSIVQEYANPKPSDTLIDLYCGAGSIGLSMAGRCGRVIGVESFKP
ncbi:MAG: class I SAM-dependent RNA methyltransferase, partial [Clostridiales bacterium]|nr:class I SAM-dependent RNA methyltransferase [Clostridiales bacterium]